MEEVIQYFGEDSDSFDLMKYVLKNAANEGDVCRFACPIGKGATYMQRVRMRITRLRVKLKKEGRSLVRFRLETQIANMTEAGEDHVTVKKVLCKNNDIEQAIDSLKIDEDLGNELAV